MALVECPPAHVYGDACHFNGNVLEQFDRQASRYPQQNSFVRRKIAPYEAFEQLNEGNMSLHGGECYLLNVAKCIITGTCQLVELTAQHTQLRMHG